MAAAEHPLWRALSGLCVCLGRPPALPRTPAGCAELLQALVTWAAPGPEAGSQKQVPARAAAALRASLLLLTAVSEASRGGHVTRARSAKAEQVLKTENAEESGKSGVCRLLLEGVCEEVGGEGPKSTEEDSCDPILQGKGEKALLSLDVAPESTGNKGGAPTSEGKTDVALLSNSNGEGALTSVAQGVVAPDSSENKGASNSKTAPDLEPVSGTSSSIIDPQCVLHCATAPLLLLCGAHIPDTQWSNAQSRRLANQLLRSLLEVSYCTSLAELLKGRQEQPFTTFREALGLLGPRLRKDTWESHPEARLVFSWMLLRVPRPWLSDFLSRVMPPSLLFSDDYKLENKVLGIHCLHHIIKNVPAAELRQYNRALVVYHALRNHLYSSEAEVLEVVLPCLLDLFPVLHKPPPAVGAYQKDAENPSDQVMQLVLTHMEMEQKTALRRLYACNLPALQDRLGVGIARHMKRLLRVIVGYLEVYDGPEETARLCILETLQGTIKYAWPRIPPRLPLLLKSLIKLIYELSAESNQNSGPVTEALLSGATECLLLLDNCSKGQVRKQQHLALQISTTQVKGVFQELKRTSSSKSMAFVQLSPVQVNWIELQYQAQPLYNTALQGIPSVCIEPLLLKCITRVLENT